MHGVPTHASGEVFDGMRAEGSVMLSDEDAQAVFDFVTIDTPVSVRTAPDNATLWRIHETRGSG